MIFKSNISSVVNYFSPLSSPFCVGSRNCLTVILTFYVHHIFTVCSSSVEKRKRQPHPIFNNSCTYLSPCFYVCVSTASYSVLVMRFCCAGFSFNIFAVTVFISYHIQYIHGSDFVAFRCLAGEKNKIEFLPKYQSEKCLLALFF